MRAFDFAAGEAWAIQQPSLKKILDIAARIHEPDWEAVALRQASRVVDEVTEMHGSVAVINVIGPVFRYANLFTMISGATSIDALAKAYGAALRDPNVSAILLNIDSPGGELAGVSELAKAIYEGRGQKKTWAYVDDLAASGGYWLGAAAERIIAADTAKLGSIGVIATITAEEDREGVKVYQFISSVSPKKRLDMETDEGQAAMQALVDELGDVFVAAVAKYRDVGAQKVLSDFGEGFIMSAARAVSAGMADEIGSFQSAIDSLSGRRQKSMAQAVGALAIVPAPAAAAAVEDPPAPVPAAEPEPAPAPAPEADQPDAPEDEPPAPDAGQDQPAQPEPEPAAPHAEPEPVPAAEEPPGPVPVVAAVAPIQPAAPAAPEAPEPQPAVETAEQARAAGWAGAYAEFDSVVSLCSIAGCGEARALEFIKAKTPLAKVSEILLSEAATAAAALETRSRIMPTAGMPGSGKPEDNPLGRAVERRNAELAAIAARRKEGY